MSEEKQYLSNGSDDDAQTPGAALEFGAQARARDRRPQVHRPARLLAARVAAAVGDRGGPTSRRGSASTAPRSAAGRGSPSRDMLLVPQAETAILDPFTARADAVAPLRDDRPDHARALRRDPRLIAQRAEALPRLDRHRRRRLLRPRERVLRLRLVAYDMIVEPRLLRGRLGRGPLELGHARARLHDPREGRLLPAAAARHAARPAQRDGADARAARHRLRVPPPRGRDRRASARSTCASRR